MKFEAKTPPRTFAVAGVEMHDCGSVRLASNEQVTFVADGGAEYDVARKDWGFYATPSLNGRLERFGLRPALVKNSDGKFYVLLVEAGKQPAFDEYLAAQRSSLVCWLDDEASLDAIELSARKLVTKDGRT